MSKLAARGGLKHHWSNPSRFKSECAYSPLSLKAGSSPALSSARVAQLAAHLICNQAAVGSNPTASLAYIAIQFVQKIHYPSVIVGIYHLHLAIPPITRLASRSTSAAANTTVPVTVPTGIWHSGRVWFIAVVLKTTDGKPSGSSNLPCVVETISLLCMRCRLPYQPEYDSVAQLAERLTVNQNVKGSNPFVVAKGIACLLLSCGALTDRLVCQITLRSSSRTSILKHLMEGWAFKSFRSDQQPRYKQTAWTSFVGMNVIA